MYDFESNYLDLEIKFITLHIVLRGAFNGQTCIWLLPGMNKSWFDERITHIRHQPEMKTWFINHILRFPFRSYFFVFPYYYYSPFIFEPEKFLYTPFVYSLTLFLTKILHFRHHPSSYHIYFRCVYITMSSCPSILRPSKSHKQNCRETFRISDNIIQHGQAALFNFSFYTITPR